MTCEQGETAQGGSGAKPKSIECPACEGDGQVYVNERDSQTPQTCGKCEGSGRVAVSRIVPPQEGTGAVTQKQPASAMQEGGNHYATMAVQPWDAMQAWMSREQFIGYLRGNAIKYLARCDVKGGVEDLRKARHYLDKLIETMEE